MVLVDTDKEGAIIFPRFGPRYALVFSSLLSKH
jgi:hypothetical protein